MRKFIVDICAGIGVAGSFFSLLWFWGQMEDPYNIFLIARISPSTAMVIGGVALASLVLAGVVSRIKTGDERAYSRFLNRDKTIPRRSNL